MNRIEAACGCSKGKVRANNEDNFYFAGEYLPAENDALRSEEHTSELQSR